MFKTVLCSIDGVRLRTDNPGLMWIVSVLMTLLMFPCMASASWQANEIIHHMAVEAAFLSLVPVVIFLFFKRKSFRKRTICLFVIVSLPIYWVIFEMMSYAWLLRLRFSVEPPINPYMLFAEKIGLSVLAGILIGTLFTILRRIPQKWVRIPLYILTFLFSFGVSAYYLPISLPPFYVKHAYIYGPMHDIGMALEYYKGDCGHYPSQEAGLIALVNPDVSCKNWDGPYVKGADKLLDHWKRPYIYEPDKEKFKLMTFGLTGQKERESEKVKIVLSYSREGWSKNIVYDGATQEINIHDF